MFTGFSGVRRVLLCLHCRNCLSPPPYWNGLNSTQMWFDALWALHSTLSFLHSCGIISFWLLFESRSQFAIALQLLSCGLGFLCPGLQNTSKSSLHYKYLAHCVWWMCCTIQYVESNRCKDRVQHIEQTYFKWLWLCLASLVLRSFPLWWQMLVNSKVASFNKRKATLK